MPVDPVTGAIIVEGIRQAFNMFGANQAASASKDAAKIQSDAALKAAGLMAETQREALGFQRDVYNQTRTDQQPWIQAGQGSVGKLAHLMGISMGGGGFSPLQASSGGGRGSGTGGLNAGSSGRQFLSTSAEPEGWLAAPRTREYGQPAAAYRWPGQMAAPEDAKPPTPNNTRTRPGFVPARRPQVAQAVLVQSPDGEVQPVDASEVEMFVQAGGKVVG